MALMFVISGCVGVLVGLAGYVFRTVRDVETLLPDQPAEQPADQAAVPAAEDQPVGTPV